MPRGSSDAPRLSGHSGLGGTFRPHTALPAKRQHSLVDNSFDTNPGSNYATHQAGDDDEEETRRHNKRLRTLTPQPHSTVEDHPPQLRSNPEDHPPHHQTPSPRATPMEEARAPTQEDTRRALLLINELTKLVNTRLDPMTISGPAKNDLTKAALNLSRLLEQRFGAPGPVNLAEEDSDGDYEHNPLDADYYADDSASNASSPTVDGSTTDPRIYTGELAESGWTESEYSGPETPESGFKEDFEAYFGMPEETYRGREIVVIKDSDGEPENRHHKEQATTAQVEKEVIEIPDDDENEGEDDDCVIFTGENVIRYMRYFSDRPVRYSPERYI